MPVTPIPRPQWPAVEVKVGDEWRRYNGGPSVVAHVLGVNRSTAWRWFRSGKLPADRVRMPVDNPGDKSGGAP